MTTPILEAKNLKKYFDQNTGLIESLFSEPTYLKAVDDVTMAIRENDSLAIIGESGCGKSTLLRTLAGLYDPTDGTLEFKGTPTSEMTRRDWREFRSSIQMIFQDPYNSLDPKFTVRETLEEMLAIHGLDDREERIHDVLDQVELQPAEKYLPRTPGNLSGGEKQRVSIARALIVDPDLLLADEPLSMLDVSTQAAILKLVNRIREERDMALVYVSHDISTVAYICEQINVMYLGRVVEQAPTGRLLAEPEHPYAQALINAVPIPDPDNKRERVTLPGSPSDPIGLGEGCRFRDRCPERMDICEQTPRFVETANGHRTACHLYYDHEAEVSVGSTPVDQTERAEQ